MTQTQSDLIAHYMRLEDSATQTDLRLYGKITQETERYIEGLNSRMHDILLEIR